MKNKFDPQGKTLICLPPNYCYTYEFPPLGTPLLCGFLKKQGIDVLQADYNMSYLDYWREKIIPAQIDSKISTRESGVVLRSLFNNLYQEKRSAKLYYSSLLPSESESVTYYDLTNSSFGFVENILSSKVLDRYLSDEQENTFLKYYQDTKILDLISKNKISFVGMSVIAPSQSLAALTLGRLIKKNLPDVHVCLGGQWVSLFRKQLAASHSFTEYIDSMIFFEGETPLLSLITALKKGLALGNVPNLIYSDKGSWKVSLVSSREDLNQIACPDFDDMPLKKYAYAARVNGPALTYQTARECYWNRCAYCVDLPLPKQGYRERSSHLVVKDLRELKKKYNFKFMEFSNAALSPRQFREMSVGLINAKMKTDWWCFSRAEAGFSRAVFAQGKKAGCVAVGFGLESASQRVLDFLDKGINFSSAYQVLQNCNNAKLGVNLQMMLGLPSETVAEALETIDFLVDNKKILNDVAFNIFYLTPDSRVFLDPSKYGIKYKRYPKLPFKFFHSFSHVTGEVDADQAENLLNLYANILSNKNKPKIKVNAVSRQDTELRLQISLGKEKARLDYIFSD
jgi:anaerobic magnesium-protoporphyrin IX monomethyl ester cyclase